MSDQGEDPAQAAVQRTLRTALMAATVAAEQVARLRQQHMARAVQQSREESARLGKQYDAHRALAVAELGAADERWFDRAEPQQVSRVWETAHTWERLEPEVFSPSAEQLRERINTRYGVDVRALPGGEVAQTGDQLRAAVRDQPHQPSEQRTAANDEAAADLVLATAPTDRAQDEAHRAAEAHNAAADHESDAGDDLTAPGYDSADRREALATRGGQAGIDQQTVGGRVRASHAQGEPVRASTRPQRAADRTKTTRHQPSQQRSSQLDR